MLNLNWQPGITLDELEKSAIKQAYAFYHKNKTSTAQALGIAIRTLDNKLEKYSHEEQTTADFQQQRRLSGEAFLRRQRGQPALPGDLEAEARLGVQPTPSTRSKPTVSLPVEKEVQEVLSSETSETGTG